LGFIGPRDVDTDASAAVPQLTLPSGRGEAVVFFQGLKDQRASLKAGIQLVSQLDGGGSGVHLRCMHRIFLAAWQLALDSLPPVRPPQWPDVAAILEGIVDMQKGTRQVVVPWSRKGVAKSVLYAELRRNAGAMCTRLPGSTAWVERDTQIRLLAFGFLKQEYAGDRQFVGVRTVTDQKDLLVVWTGCPRAANG
jgi:hypothetical protein